MRYSFKAGLAVSKHQEIYEELILTVEDDCFGEIYELEVSEDLVQLLKLEFTTKQDALLCKQKLLKLFPDIELSEIQQYA